MKNFNNQERQIGFEIEYSGLELSRVADLVVSLFDGKIIKRNSTLYDIKNTKVGNFKLELDAIPIQKIAKQTQFLKEKSDKNLSDNINLHINELIESTASVIAPYEIVLPPVKMSQLSKIEKLRERLQKEGAKDTFDSFYTAFGLHINPEVASLEVDYIVRHIQSFLLLSPLLEEIHNIDLSRRLSRFIEPFPETYHVLILDKNYKPNLEQLIKDYYEYNPTRNRALDMLPLFAYLNEALVRELYGQDEKINKRPTFHYRLPNCEIANEKWTL